MLNITKQVRQTTRNIIGPLACLIVLATLLVLAGCGDSSSPSKPGNQPSNGYSIISLFEQEIGNFLP